MHYEVETKYRVDDVARVEGLLNQLGAVAGEIHRQVDQYFAHPSRDFATTDEALRIRETDNATYRVTYKGPKLDATTKTRRELELPIGEQEAAAGFRELLVALGFEPNRIVAKTRRVYHLDWRTHRVEIAVDAVDNLGTFVELEISAVEAQLDNARDALLTLAEQLSLTESERRSYLELLIDAEA